MDEKPLDWTPSIVSMRHYLAASPDRQKSMVPAIPAIYYWVIDFDGPSRMRSEWDALLRSISSLRGPKQRVKNLSHLDIECWISPEAIDPEFGDGLADIAGDDALRIWMGQVLTTIQRPLYVGITTDLFRRVEEHLNDPGGLNATIGDQLDLTECAISYFELPESLIQQIFAGNHESPEENDPTQDDDDGDYSIVQQDELLSPDALRTIEYVAIRASMPTFNIVRRSGQ